MIVLVTGTRTLTRKTCAEVFTASTVAQAATFALMGECEGVDTFAKEFFRARGVRGVQLHASWDEQGPQAGPIRNSRLVACALSVRAKTNTPAHCLAIWDGQSDGTADALRKALAAELPAEVWIVKGAPPRLAPMNEVLRLLEAQAERKRKRTTHKEP